MTHQYDRVAIDAEWSQREYITVQYGFYDGYRLVETVVLWSDKFPAPTNIPPNTRVIVCDLPTTNIFSTGVALASEVELVFYFSPKDIEAALGVEPWREALKCTKKGRTITKKRNLTGAVILDGVKFRLKDYFGMFNASLDKALKSVGIDNPYKSSVTELGHSKGRMDLFALEFPDEFLLYALGDVIHMGDLFTRNFSQKVTVIEKALGIKCMHTHDNFPGSSGALVAKTYESWIGQTHPDLLRAVLNLSQNLNDKAYRHIAMIRDEMPKCEGSVNKLFDLNDKVRNAEGVLHGMAMGSIAGYEPLSRIGGDTAIYGAVVHGGYCGTFTQNLNPYHNRITNPYDPDNSACYGTALRKMDMPYGIPSCLASTPDRVITLGAYLKACEQELLPGLWQVLVSGTLSFNQDLIHSKCGLDTGKVRLKILSGEYSEKDEVVVNVRDTGVAHIGGSFEMNTREITLGVVTHDVLKLLRKVCTNAELNEFMALEVVMASCYPKSKEVTVEVWSEMINSGNFGAIRTLVGRDATQTQYTDNRNREWCRVSFEDFVGGFADYRAMMKREAGGDKDSQAWLIQNDVKLFVNTTYGCLASPYFPMGNTIVANNITARARTGGWQLSKPLLLAQLITDGGLGSGDAIAYVKSGRKLPGMATLSNRGKFLSHKSIGVRPLIEGGKGEGWLKAWMLSEAGGEKALDVAVNAVVLEFWRHWGYTELLFDVECKASNTGVYATYAPSADYLIWDVMGESVGVVLPLDVDTGVRSLMKVRGAKEVDHPKKVWLMHLLDQRYDMPPVEFQRRELIGVTDWQKKPHDELMPGDDIEVTTVHRPHNLGMPPETHAERARGEKTHAEQSRKHDKAGRLTQYGQARAVEKGDLSPTKTPARFKGKRIITEL